MVTHLQNKSSMDVSADSSLCESLSFSGFLSIQDLQSKNSPTNSINQIKKQDCELESGKKTPVSAVHCSNKNCPADMSVSTGQLQLQAFLCQSKQIRVTHKPGSKGATPTSNKRSRDGTNGMKFSAKPTYKEKRGTKNEHAASSSSFGQKIFLALLSPCRECKAHKPAAEAHITPGEPVKLH